MMALLRSEILRFRSRSLVAVVVVGGVLLIGVGLGLAMIGSQKPTALETHQSQIQLDRCPVDPSATSFQPDSQSYGLYGYVDYRCFEQFRSAEFAPSGYSPAYGSDPAPHPHGPAREPGRTGGRRGFPGFRCRRLHHGRLAAGRRRLPGKRNLTALDTISSIPAIVCRGLPPAATVRNE